ncbi:MAG: peptide ABC transporter substrate-binding protein [Pseudomonadota bacterium]
MRRSVATAAILAFTTSLAMAEVVYNRGNSGDPETLDHHKTSTVYEANILRDLYEGLVIYDAKAQVIPGVATDWTVSDDGLVYTFNLREDAKWSNGDTVTADDFVFAFQRIMAPDTGAKYANILFPIKNAEAVNKGELEAALMGVKAVDATTLEITLQNSTPYFIELLTHQTGLPLHQASVEAHGTEFTRPGNLVTNGAYMLESYTPNDSLVAVKNPNFHAADTVQIDKVVYFPIEDRGAALRRFQAGELHSHNDAPTEQMAFMKENLGDQLRIAPYLGNYYYAVNHEDEDLGKPEVRQALSMAIDREFVATEIWGDAMVPAYSFVPPGIGNYGEPAFAEYKGMSMIDREDKAIELLEAAGYGPDNPLEVEIRYNTSENHKNTAVAIADMWKPLGVEVTFLNTDVTTHYAHLRDRGDFDVARAGWIGDYSDPQNFLFMVESDNTGFNYARYENAEYDALMDKAAATADLDERATILKEAEEMFMADLPFIPILYYGSLSLVSDKLKGWEDNIQNVHATRWKSIEG